MTIIEQIWDKARKLRQEHNTRGFSVCVYVGDAEYFELMNSNDSAVNYRMELVFGYSIIHVFKDTHLNVTIGETK